MKKREMENLKTIELNLEREGERERWRGGNGDWPVKSQTRKVYNFFSSS